MDFNNFTEGDNQINEDNFAFDQKKKSSSKKENLDSKMDLKTIKEEDESEFISRQKSRSRKGGKSTTEF